MGRLAKRSSALAGVGVFGFIVLSTALLDSVALAQGQAVITRAEGLETKGFIVGNPLQEGQVIETPADKSADILINNLVGVRLLPGTRAKLERLAPDQMTLLLASGNILVNSKPLPDSASFSVATPLVVAAVRGTQFWGRALSPEQTHRPGEVTFAVREGSVELTWLKTGDKSMLRPGDAADVKSSDIVLAPVRRALSEEMMALAQADAIATSA